MPRLKVFTGEDARRDAVEDSAELVDSAESEESVGERRKQRFWEERQVNATGQRHYRRAA